MLVGLLFVGFGQCIMHTGKCKSNKENWYQGCLRISNLTQKRSLRFIFSNDKPKRKMHPKFLGLLVLTSDFNFIRKFG